MPCISPPELNDLTLLAYLDGEADSDVASHLNRCSHCREKAYRLARLQDRMTDQLYRITCPPSHELGEYYLGMLSPDKAAATARHLAECPRCTSEIAQLQGYLEALGADLESSPLERIKVWVARLVEDTPVFGSPGALPIASAYAGMRGEESGPYLYRADEAQVVIEIQPDAERPDRHVLLGLVTGVDPHELKAHLWQANQLIATVLVDELGNFAIPGLEPASYELILGGPEVEIHVQELRVAVS